MYEEHVSDRIFTNLTSGSAISASTESNKKKIKMATQDSSPSLIIGQQWSALAELISSDTENEEDDKDKDGNKNASDSMKLGRQDMGLFGFCPSRDEFSLVVCEKCNFLVKPQALKQHIESRHGPTNLSSLGNVPASALNSELGKKLLMPLPSKSSTPPPSTTSSKERQSSGTFKPVSSGRPPTKASLKQVPAAVKNIPAPRLGVSMKISPMKSVKSGNRITSSSASAAISSPVVKVEKLEKLGMKSSSSKAGADINDHSESPPNLSKSVMNIDSSKISTLVNGSIKSAISLTTPSSSTTTSPSIVSTPMLVAVTKTSTDTPLSMRSVTTVVTTTTTTTTRTKPLMIAPVMTVGSTVPMAARPVTSSKSSKSSKDQKERKFLPCKDREYDANKHCGVKVSETGKPCTRSLTCKTHALSLRRAVPGRSKTFDDLLKEHKAAKDALLKAKAESQNAMAAVHSLTPGNRVMTSPAHVSSTLNIIKQQPTNPAMSPRDGKIGQISGLAASPRMMVPSSAVPTTTTFAKPRSVSNVFQRFTPSALLPPAITVKEESTAKHDSPSKVSLSSSGELSRSDSQDSRPDKNFISHHPKPMAVSQFGGRLNDRGCFLFSRKMDYVRAAFLSALERQLNPPPHKKLCVESNLPKESQVMSNSQDPYEFNMVDNSGGTAFSMSASLVNASKPAIKPKSKLPTSPVAASNSNPLSLSSITFSCASAAASLSLSCTSHTTLSATPIAVSNVTPSGLALNWSVKSRDGVKSCSPSESPSPSLSSTPVINPGKRKRSGSSGGSNSQLVAVAASGNGALPVAPTISTTNLSTGGSTQQTALAGIMTSTSLNSNQTGNLIAIPSVNLSSTNLSQINAGSLGTAKLNASSGGSASGSVHKNNNIFRDFNLVLTGIDSPQFNGQLVNITSAQLAELAASQGHTLLLNNFNPSGNSSSSSSGTTASFSMTGSVPTSRSAKRSRSSGSKTHQSLPNSASSKISGNALEGFKLIPSNSVISSGGLPVLMNSDSLQGAMLTSVALATGGTTPTLVAITSSTANSNSVTVAGNSSQVLSTDSSACLGSSSTLINGLTQFDKSGSHPVRHHSSSTKSHHHHQQQHTKAQQQQQNIALGNVIQASPQPIAVPIPTGSAAQLCSNQIFKSVGGKLTMQPVSLTIPINVSQAGLAAFASNKPQQLQQQQQQQQQQQHTLLVATSGGTTGDVAGKTDLHIQPQISSSSPGNLIS